MRYIIDPASGIVISVINVPAVCLNGTELKQADRKLSETALQIDKK